MNGVNRVDLTRGSLGKPEHHAITIGLLETGILINSDRFGKPQQKIVTLHQHLVFQVVAYLKGL